MTKYLGLAFFWWVLPSTWNPAVCFLMVMLMWHWEDERERRDKQNR
jgi:hypothetical protein